MRKTAFTLAEVLIALLIVGLIAALTLPNFFGNTNSKTDSLLLKATYGQFSDALQQAMIDQGVRSIYDLEFDGANNQAKLSSFLNKYFEVIKDCGADSSDCFADSYTSYNGSNVSNPFSYENKDMMEYVKLTNGVSLAVRIDFTGADKDKDVVMFDVNGNAKKNVIGKDLFAELINENGSLGSEQFKPDDLNTYKQTCKGDGAAKAAKECLLILKAKDWDLEHYLD